MYVYVHMYAAANYLRKLLLGKMYIWEVAAIPSWGSCHLGNFHLGKCTFGKLPLGKRPLRKYQTLRRALQLVRHIIMRSNLPPKLLIRICDLIAPLALHTFSSKRN